MYNAGRIAALLLLLTQISACDPWSSPDSMMDEYLVRLARVLAVENQPSDIMQVMTLPRPRDRRVEIHPMQINMLDFLSLYGCELQVVVGERNSIMGRVMTPLNKLRYQQRFIDKARQCLPKIEQAGLKQQLRKAIKHKKTTLPAYFWNAVWSDEPMASLLTQSKGVFDPEQNRASLSQLKSDLGQTLTVSKQLMSGRVDVDLTAMSEIHQRWVFNHQPGQLMNSARLLTTRLNDASVLIEQRLKAKPLCYMKKPTMQADRVKGVFFHVYIGRVQPYVAKVSQAAEQIFGRLGTLADSQSALMPDQFRPFYRKVIDIQRPGSLWDGLDTAIKRHTENWQRLLDQCGMRPGAD